MNPMKLYIGCSLTVAPTDFCEQVERLKNLFRGDYEVFDFVGTIAGTAEDVFQWDIGHCVADCDIFIAICDYTSIGLGWELSEAISLGKTTLGVAHVDSLVSRLVLGAATLKPNFRFARYNDLLADVPQLLSTLLDQTANI